LGLESGGLAQGVFGIIGDGTEAKAHGGAGQIASRGSPALYYNPANIIDMPAGFSTYSSLDFLHFFYEYQYPGYESVTVEQKTPLPSLGLSWRPTKSWAFALSYLMKFAVKIWVQGNLLSQTSCPGRVAGIRNRGFSYDIYALSIHSEGIC